MKRYRIQDNHGWQYSPTETPDGRWVRYEDVGPLELANTGMQELIQKQEDRARKLEARIRELESERDATQKRFELVSKNAAEFGIERDELLDRVKKLQAENERLTEIARKYKLLCEAVGGSDADCLPTCDSEFHDEKCPSVIPAEHIVNLQAHIERLKAELEQLTVQMAGVSVAALGGTKDPAKQGDYGWSVPYQDVLNLRLKYDELAKP